MTIFATIYIKFRALKKYKAKQDIMGRTGNTGPPETDLEGSLG